MGDSNLCILSYDVDGRDRSTASRVCHLIFGRKNTTTAAGISKAYEQAGFIHRPGVVWVGQSVLILPQRDAMDLRRRLEGMGVSVGPRPADDRRLGPRGFSAEAAPWGAQLTC